MVYGNNNVNLTGDPQDQVYSQKIAPFPNIHL